MLSHESHTPSRKDGFRWLLSAVSADRGHFCLALVAGQRQILSSGGEIDIQSSLWTLKIFEAWRWRHTVTYWNTNVIPSLAHTSTIPCHTCLLWALGVEVSVEPVDRTTSKNELRITWPMWHGPATDIHRYPADWGCPTCLRYTTIIKTTPFFDRTKNYIYNGAGSLDIPGLWCWKNGGTTPNSSGLTWFNMV